MPFSLLPRSSDNPVPGIGVDIFCRVIDNFGDAGVAWRLAQRLKCLGFVPRLIIDRVDVLHKLVPALDPTTRIGIADGVTIVEWQTFEECSLSHNPCTEPQELVIEAFACRLPPSYEEAMVTKTPVLYLNLDYLSAEDWVESCHNVAGLHPSLPISKLWFFPGFTDRTGGLMIEDDYESRRDAFLKEKDTFLKTLGADPTLLTLFFFAYPVNDIESLAKAFCRDDRALQILVAPGQAGEKLCEYLERKAQNAQHIRIVRVPMVPQIDFDKYLWASDAAVIRGEDSFVRAQLAALPLIWATYPTQDNAHHIKMNAWLARFNKLFEKNETADIFSRINTTWLAGQLTPQEWSLWRNELPQIKKTASKWRDQLFERGDLARKIAQLVLERLK